MILAAWAVSARSKLRPFACLKWRKDDAGRGTAEPLAALILAMLERCNAALSTSVEVRIKGASPQSFDKQASLRDECAPGAHL